MAYAPGQNYQLRYALAVAMLVHGLVLFGLTVQQALEPLTSPADMEVIVTLNASSQRPDTAEFISQANQLGSGDDNNSLQSEIPRQALLFDETLADEKLNITAAPENERPTANFAYRIIATVMEGLWNIGNNDIQTRSTEQQALLKEQQKTLDELSIAVAKLENRLFNKQRPKNKKPRTLLITSSSALANENAAYIKQWRDRVETIGNLNYPQEARDKQLYGDVRLLVSVLSSGVVDKISILSSSGNSILDSAAIESIHLASPFEPFPSAIASRYDRIDVIRTWQFRKNRVSSRADSLL